MLMFSIFGASGVHSYVVGFLVSLVSKPYMVVVSIFPLSLYNPYIALFLNPEDTILM